MKPVEPAEFFVVLEACTDATALGCRSIFGPKQSRIVISNYTIEQAAFDFVERWNWRPGDYKTRVHGWRTLAGAQRYARKLAAQCGGNFEEKFNRGGVRVYQLMEDEAEEWHILPVECGAPDTADREQPATDRGPADESPRG